MNQDWIREKKERVDLFLSARLQEEERSHEERKQMGQYGH